MEEFGARQPLGQQRTRWLAADLALAAGLVIATAAKLGELFFDGEEVGVKSLIEQAELLGAQMLTAAAELPAVEYGDLMRELLDLGVTPFDLLLPEIDFMISTGKLFLLEFQLIRDDLDLVFIIGNLAH